MTTIVVTIITVITVDVVSVIAIVTVVVATIFMVIHMFHYYLCIIPTSAIVVTILAITAIAFTILILLCCSIISDFSLLFVYCYWTSTINVCIKLLPLVLSERFSPATLVLVSYYQSVVILAVTFTSMVIVVATSIIVLLPSDLYYLLVVMTIAIITISVIAGEKAYAHPDTQAFAYACIHAYTRSVVEFVPVRSWKCRDSTPKPSTQQFVHIYI